MENLTDQLVIKVLSVMGLEQSARCSHETGDHETSVSHVVWTAKWKLHTKTAQCYE